MALLKKTGFATVLFSYLSLISVSNADNYYNKNVAANPPQASPQGPQGGTVYPGFGGQYVAPQPVNPGEDDADAIYRANEHQGE